MQIIGLIVLAGVIGFGFTERSGQVTAFDLHAFVMVFFGSIAAVMISSTARNAWRTLACFRELIPFTGTLRPNTRRMEAERKEFVSLWRDGRRAQAVELAERSRYATTRHMLELVLARASVKAADSAFLELRHQELERWQPANTNWELLSRLGPSFGLVGTITGMVQLFKNMGHDNLNIGASMSLALVSTLYGTAFGAGMAGPVGNFLRGLIDERLGVLDRCRQSTIELAEL